MFSLKNLCVKSAVLGLVLSSSLAFAANSSSSYAGSAMQGNSNGNFHPQMDQSSMDTRAQSNYGNHMQNASYGAAQGSSNQPYGNQMYGNQMYGNQGFNRGQEYRNYDSQASGYNAQDKRDYNMQSGQQSSYTMPSSSQSYGQPGYNAGMQETGKY